MSAIAYAADWGPLVTLTDVDEAIIATLDQWLPTYLGKVEAEHELATGFLARPTLGSYTNALTSVEFLDHALPAIIVTTAQTTGPIVRAAGGYDLAIFQVVVSCVVRGSTPKQTRYNASYCEGSVRRALTQKATAGPTIVTNCLWVTSSIEKVADTTGAGRYLAAGITRFDVAVDGAVLASPDAGPEIPDAVSYSPLATVADIDYDLEALPITGVTP